MLLERKNPYTEFGLSVQHRLLDLNRTNQWLVKAVAEKGSCFMDSPYLLKILTGQEKADRKRELIEQVLAEEESRQEAAHGEN